MNALTLLWPDGIEHSKVLLFATDCAAYMVKAGEALKVLFPRMLHITCAAHAAHRVAEEIRVMYPDVDKLISNGKKVFRKCPSRVSIFRETVPGIPLSPRPVLTRWGTWLQAALYYAKNFVDFSTVLDSFDESESASIEITRATLSKPSLRADLAFIAAHFGCLPIAIERLETRGASVVDSVGIFENLMQNLKRTPGPIGTRIRRKCDAVIKRNPDYLRVKAIANVLSGHSTTPVIGFEPSALATFKFAPITSVDVERSFSCLKNILTDRRQAFTVENLKMVLVIN